MAVIRVRKMQPSNQMFEVGNDRLTEGVVHPGDHSLQIGSLQLQVVFEDVAHKLGENPVSPPGLEGPLLGKTQHEVPQCRRVEYTCIQQYDFRHVLHGSGRRREQVDIVGRPVRRPLAARVAQLAADADSR
jgi:hypothetical protein